jgi:adenosylmethionine-8-amino-7-oxononanoate aminotransferase
VIEDDDLLERCRRMGALLRERLDATFADHPHVGDIRGRGLFVGIELVEDRPSKKPFDPSLKLHARVKAAAMAEGLMIYPSGGTADGTAGDHVLVAPPFIIDEDGVALIVDRLAAALAAAFGEAGVKAA